MFYDELKLGGKKPSDMEVDLITHNNFGICGSVRIKAKNVGKSVVQSFATQIAGSSLVHSKIQKIHS